MRKFITKISSLGLVVLTMAGCAGKSKNANQVAVQVLPYKTAPVYSGPATIYYIFPASIQGEQNVEIRPKVDGFVEHIYIDEGSVVHKGQLLFKLNNPQYEEAVRSAAASVKIAEANVQAAEMNVEKVKPLVEKDIISKYELQSNEYTLQSQHASLASAQANLVNAKVNVGYTSISSPANGVIGALPYKVGSLVSSTSANPLTTVYNTKNVYAYFSLNEKQLLGFTRSARGKTLEDKLANLPDVSLILADGTEYAEKGRITTISGLISTETGSANLRGTFPNQRGLIRSGSSGMVKVPVHLDSAILIPQRATFDIQSKKFVYLLKDKDSIVNAAIQVSANTIGDLYVVESGLKPGDAIVLEGISNLHTGMTIKPVMVRADSLYQAAKP